MSRESSVVLNRDDCWTDSEDNNDLDGYIEEEKPESTTKRMGIEPYQFEPLTRISEETSVDSSPESEEEPTWGLNNTQLYLLFVYITIYDGFKLENSLYSMVISSCYFIARKSLILRSNKPLQC